MRYIQEVTQIQISKTLREAVSTRRKFCEINSQTWLHVIFNVNNERGLFCFYVVRNVEQWAPATLKRIDISYPKYVFLTSVVLCKNCMCKRVYPTSVIRSHFVFCKMAICSFQTVGKIWIYPLFTTSCPRELLSKTTDLTNASMHSKHAYLNHSCYDANGVLQNSKRYLDCVRVGHYFYI